MMEERLCGNFRLYWIEAPRVAEALPRLDLANRNLGAYRRGQCSMRRDSVLLSAVLTSAITLLLFGCGENSMTSTTPPPQTVQPTVAAISPTNVPAGSGNFILTIIGTGLGMTSQVKFGRAVLMPSSATPTKCPAGGSCVALSVNVPAQDVASATTITVSVANASLASNAVAFAVTPQSGDRKSVV